LLYTGLFISLEGIIAVAGLIASF